MAKDNTVDLVIGLAVLGGAAWAISQGWLGKAVDALLNLKLPDLGGIVGGGGGGTDTGGGGGTDTGGGSTGGSPTGTTKVAAAGDWGSGRNSNWQKVVAAMAKKAPDVVLVPGDQSYAGGPAKFKPVTDAIRKFAKKVFGADGNHDGGGYAANFDAYSNSVNTYGNVSFMSLDANNTATAISYARTNFSKMTAKYKVVFFHQPGVSPSSSHGVGGMKALIPDFAKNKINVVIQAHNHIYVRYVTTDGVTYFISGLGGESAYPIGSNCSGCPAMAKSYNSTFGFLYLEFGPSSITGQFIDVSDKVIDSFTLGGTAAMARVSNI